VAGTWSSSEAARNEQKKGVFMKGGGNMVSGKLWDSSNLAADSWR
jgi:hypothetical protein